MVPAFLRRHDPSDYLAMVFAGVGVWGVWMLLIAFFESGLKWWLDITDQPGLGTALLLCCIVSTVIFWFCVVLRAGVAVTARLDIGIGFWSVMLSLVAFTGLLNLSRISQVDLPNLGPVSLYRAEHLRAQLREFDRASALDPNRQVPQTVLDDIVEFRVALAVGSHAGIHQAHARMVDAVRDRALVHVFNAAATLGLHEHDSLRAAHARGWMPRSEFKQLQAAVRARASSLHAARPLTPLEAAAYMALAEDRLEGLDVVAFDPEASP